MAITWRGANAVTWISPPITELALPGATEIGDWLFLVGNAGVSFTCTDARFERAAILDIPDGPEYGEAWIGQATTLDPVTFEADPGIAGANVIIGAAATADVPNLSRLSTVSATTNNYTLPGVRGVGGGAIAMMAGAHGLGGSSWEEPPGWVRRIQSGAYVPGVLATTDAAVVESVAAVWTHTTAQMRLAGVVIGLGGASVAPPCRLFPREDGIGVGGGRHFPPPKSQQRSGRRFGYY